MSEPKPVSVIVFVYNSYKDPLFQNLLLKYISTLSKKGSYRFDLVTFEQDDYKLTKGEIDQEKKTPATAKYILASFDVSYWTLSVA